MTRLSMATAPIVDSCSSPVRDHSRIRLTEGAEKLTMPST